MTVISRLSQISSRFSLCSPRNVRTDLVRNFKSGRQKQPKFQNVEKEPAGTGTILARFSIYTGLFVPVAFTGCMIWQYEEIRSRALKKVNVVVNRQKEMSFRESMNHIWNSLHPGKRAVAGVIAANVAVFVLWRIPACIPMMYRFFINTPTAAHSALSQTLSGFSHLAPLHLLINMYVLWSFSGPIVSILGKEQFMAVYLGSATFSAWTSCVMKHLSGRLNPSQGASGAIMAMIGMVCYKHPDGRLSIVLVDQIIPHSFTAQSALIGLIMFDLCGMLFFKRSPLDHGAHLGGMAFGLLYVMYGQKLVWEKLRPSLVKKWHKLRN